MTIGFDQISLSINTPGVFVEFDNSRAVQGLGAAPHDVLITGQKLAGAAVAGQIYAVASDAEAVALFGAKSMLRQQIKQYKLVDSLTQVYACSSAVDSGTAAAGGWTWTGTATEDGEVVFYVGGRRIPVAVSDGDDSAALEAAALAAFALVDDDLPVSVVGNIATGIDLTAVQAGTCGNQIYLGLCLLPGERTPAGFTFTPVAMTGGATDPAFTGVVTAMGSDQYHTIAIGLCTDTVLDAFEAQLESRWGPMLAIEGQAFAAIYDARADLTTFGNARNSFTTTVVGAEESAALPLPWELSAQTAALSALRAKSDPSRALTGQSYVGFTAAPRGSRFTRAERDILLSDGISTVYAGNDGRLRSERLITTWQTNAGGLPDASYLDLTTVRLLARLRYDVRARILSRFGQFKLASDSTPIPAGQPIVTPSIMKSEMISLFGDWSDQGWVEDPEQFADELVVERDGSDPNRINMILPPNLINNLLVTAAKISFLR